MLTRGSKELGKTLRSRGCLALQTPARAHPTGRGADASLEVAQAA